MRFFEMETKPTRAGLAKIDWQEDGWFHREGDTICLPAQRNLEFFWLGENKRQFVVRNPGHRYHGGCYFGGTDENPFLVGISDGALETFLERGAEAFYSSLLPRDLLGLAALLKMSIGELTRQGDIFALPIPFTWKELRTAQVLIGEEAPIAPKAPGKDSGIFGTRHTLKGRCINRLDLFPRARNGHRGYTLAEGVVEAPDHSPLELKGVHALGQTEWLSDPRSAD